MVKAPLYPLRFEPIYKNKEKEIKPYIDFLAELELKSLEQVL